MTHLHSPIKEKLDSISMKAAADLCFTLCSVPGERQLRIDMVACNVCLDTSGKMSWLGTHANLMLAFLSFHSMSV